jgi:putative endonuclease
MNSVYILRCSDGTLYTGSTVDLKKRVREHNESKQGAKYTRARRPVKLVYSEDFEELSDARSREAEIKRLTREEKLQLVKGI